MSDRRPFDSGPLVDPDERQAIFATLDSFRQYRRQSHYNITHRRRQNLYALPTQQWQTLATPTLNLLDVFSNVDDAIDHNADIADAILELALRNFDLPTEPERGTPQNWHGTARPGDLTKVHSTVRQFYRDWSEEGFTAEVEPLLKIVLDDLNYLTRSITTTRIPSLLLPGAGLGRLLFELSRQGYNVEGNEISYHQLLASNFILNGTKCDQQYKLYPFASTFTNHKMRTNQLKSVLIPNIHPASVLAQSGAPELSHMPASGNMNMVAGDFLTTYKDEDSFSTFDVVLSVYFIDTAPNLIRYIETVRHCLKDGGLWINVGPLLWHFDDRNIGDLKTEKEQCSTTTKVQANGEPNGASSIADVDTGIAEPGSFELTDEEVLLLLRQMGFEILKHDYLPTSCGGYIQDPNSMVQNRYESSHWVARKIPPK